MIDLDQNRTYSNSGARRPRAVRPNFGICPGEVVLTEKSGALMHSTILIGLRMLNNDPLANFTSETEESLFYTITERII